MPSQEHAGYVVTLESDVNVGDICKIERRMRGSVDHTWEQRIVKLTPKRAYLSGGSWFALDDPSREVKPRYLEYTTTVAEVRRG